MIETNKIEVETRCRHVRGSHVVPGVTSVRSAEIADTSPVTRQGAPRARKRSN